MAQKVHSHHSSTGIVSEVLPYTPSSGRISKYSQTAQNPPFRHLRRPGSVTGPSCKGLCVQHEGALQDSGPGRGPGGARALCGQQRPAPKAVFMSVTAEAASPHWVIAPGHGTSDQGRRDTQARTRGGPSTPGCSSFIHPTNIFEPLMGTRCLQDLGP